MGILDYFPAKLTPRKEQVDALLRLEKEWDSHDVFILNLPVSVGKSAIAITISAWQAANKSRTSILTPSNILVKQYLADYPHLHTIHKRDSYSCSATMEQTSCSSTYSRKKFYCKGCPYKADLAKKDWIPVSVVNYYTYLAYKMYREVVVIDEAHQLRGMVADQMSHLIWSHKYKYPFYLTSYDGLKKWVDSNPKTPNDKVLKLLHKELNSPFPKYLVQKGTEYYRGRQEELLKVIPVDTRDYSGLLWPFTRVKKLVLMSATISSTDVQQLGLSKRRVITIESGSPIPKERRPIYFDESSALTVSVRSTEQDHQKLADRILNIIEENPNQKGFVHITYSLMETLRPYLEGKSERLMFHTRQDKMYKYSQYRADNTDKVLMACGLYEGVDLLEDMGRFQIITKVPWPSLAEPATRWVAEVNPSHYAWEAVKVVIQATGRICRSPTDFGKTIVIDRSFKRLYNQNTEQFPNWFKEGVVWS